MGLQSQCYLVKQSAAMEGVWRKTMLMLGVMALLSAHCMAQLTCEPQTSVFGFDETPAVAMDGPVVHAPPSNAARRSHER